MSQVVLNVNGDRYDLEVAPVRRLANVLRDDLGLTGQRSPAVTARAPFCSTLALSPLFSFPVAAEEGHAVVTIEGKGHAGLPAPEPETGAAEKPRL